MGVGREVSYEVESEDVQEGDGREQENRRKEG